MEGLVLQDWITIEAASGQTSVAQSSGAWLETSRYTDATFWLSISELSFSVGGPTLTLHIETAPSMDERTFVPLVPDGFLVSSIGAGASPLIRTVRASANYVPIARWVRWRLQVAGVGLPGDWSITFRILLAANAPRIPLGA